MFIPLKGVLKIAPGGLPCALGRRVRRKLAEGGATRSDRMEETSGVRRLPEAVRRVGAAHQLSRGHSSQRKRAGPPLRGDVYPEDSPW